MSTNTRILLHDFVFYLVLWLTLHQKRGKIEIILYNYDGFYDKVLDLDENNFDANLALGLIYLNEFLSDKNNLEAQYNAQTYLLTANSVKPYAVNALKGLALYYETTNEEDQLDRVNVLLNQLSNN